VESVQKAIPQKMTPLINMQQNGPEIGKQYHMIFFKKKLGPWKKVSKNSVVKSHIFFFYFRNRKIQKKSSLKH